MTGNVAIDLEGELQRRFEVLQGYYGIKNATELVRVLINEKYREILPSEAKR